MSVLIAGSEPGIAFKLVDADDDETPIDLSDTSTIEVWIGTASGFNQVTPSINNFGRGWYNFTLDLSGISDGPLIVEAVAPGTNIWSYLYEVTQRQLTTADVVDIANGVLTRNFGSVADPFDAGDTTFQAEPNLLNYGRSGLPQTELAIPPGSGTATSYRENGVTTARTYTVTTDASAAPFVAVEPV